MTQFVIANNVNTQLAAAASSAATTLTLASATNLPTLTTGQIMPLTLNDAATGGIYEIVYVTAISGVTLTVERAQEGTGALNWNLGDYAYCAPTAGTVATALGNPNDTFAVALATAPQHAAQFSQTTGRLLNVQAFKTHGTFTYTKTPGTTAAYAECQGAGGSGGGTAATGASQCAMGGGGGTGAFASSWLPTGIASGTTITIGQGGVQTNGGSNNGGSSSIGAIMTAPGGKGGTIAAPTTAPWLTGGGSGATGVATGGNLLNTSGQSGDTSLALTSGSALVGGAGGASVYGGGGSVTAGNTAGNSGVAPGSGGSGTATGASQATIAGGPGADGVVFIYEYGTI